MLDAPSYLLGKKAGGGGSNLQSKSVEITENGTTDIRPDTGYDGLSKVDVTVTGILDTSDADAVSSDIAISKTAYVNGNKVTGNVPIGSPLVATNYSSNNVGIYLDDLQIDTEQRNINQMFRSGDKISVYAPLSDVATTVGAVANKIKKDEVICGVTGTYEGGGGTTEAEEKDVNFYDYDGTRVYSYTKNEFLALTEMPENPTHSGLTSQGWNWSLADAKDYVTDYGFLNVGQLYVTSDNKTRLYVNLGEGRTSITVGFAINGTATINWGDNTSDTVIGSSITTVMRTSHTYSSDGEYVISIDSQENIYISGSYQVRSYLLYDINNETLSGNYFPKRIKKIELGGNVVLNGSAFEALQFETITIPNNSNLVANNAGDLFRNCSSVKCIIFGSQNNNIGSRTFYNCGAEHIIFPKNINMPNNCFQRCGLLKSFCTPYNKTNTNIELSQYLFDGCYKIEKIVINNKVNNYNNYCFSDCSNVTKLEFTAITSYIYNVAFRNMLSIKYFDFSKCTNIPTLADTGAFMNCPSDYQIIVPDDLYETWKTTGNWSNSAVVDHIVKASEV